MVKERKPSYDAESNGSTTTAPELNPTLRPLGISRLMSRSQPDLFNTEVAKEPIMEEQAHAHSTPSLFRSGMVNMDVLKHLRLRRQLTLIPEDKAKEKQWPDLHHSELGTNMDDKAPIDMYDRIASDMQLAQGKHNVETLTELAPLLQRPERTGDTISTPRAILTLSKAMFNAGCFTVPFAWKLGGLYVAIAIQLCISGLNWYGNYILVRSAQHMAVTYGRPALDYGHFTKKVFDYSGIPHFSRNSKRYMYFVNVAILFYQLGMCSVSILFISTNLEKLVFDYAGVDLPMPLYATIAFLIVLATNMVTELRVLSVFAVASSLLFLTGAVAILYYCIVMTPLKIAEVPKYTNFWDTLSMIGIVVYAFEGQTMILPIENKLKNPNDFLRPTGVLTCTMLLCTTLLSVIAFFGFTAFAEDTASTLTLNLPTSWNVVIIPLIAQSLLGHSLQMYVVFDMFWSGFSRKAKARFGFWNEHTVLLDKLFRTVWVFITYVMAVSIPKLDVLIPIVGILSGTMCAMVFPPMLESLAMWSAWQHQGVLNRNLFKNGVMISIGVVLIVAGTIANMRSLYNTYATGDPYDTGDL